MLQETEISLILNSDPASGSTRQSADGSQFEVDLLSSMRLPKEGLNCTISLEQASVWWVMPNIVSGVNDKMYITGPNVAGTTTAFTITIPQGLYDLASLDNTIQALLQNADAKISPFPIVSLSGDDATQKAVFLMNYTDVEIDFTQTDTPQGILGYDSRVVGPFTGAPQHEFADNIASFNQISNFLIHTDLADEGLMLNNSYSQVIGQVLIDVNPGSQVNYQPTHAPKCSASRLLGSSRDSIRVWITDQSNNAINMNSENFSIRLTLRYQTPYFVERR